MVFVTAPLPESMTLPMTLPDHSLELDAWKELEKLHGSKIARWTVPFRERRRVGVSHPVHDFLFVYYQYSPAKLEQWHPGVGILLENAANHADFPEDTYTAVGNSNFCDPTKLKPKPLARLRWISELLERTAKSRPNFSCLGMHEWAMVYQGDEIRHEKTTPLRLPQKEINHLVETRPITCTHFDAFRFFALNARPLNKFQPTLESRIEMEQPACIHANMDLYKWAFKSMPWVGSELVAACFELALEAREVDMRASPYDLSYLDGWNPIKIETPEGRLEYEECQRAIAAKSEPLRRKLKAKIDQVLRMATGNII